MKLFIRRARLILLGFLLAELIVRLSFLTFLTDLEKTRRFMAGELDAAAPFVTCIAQPYLFYVPNPNYVNAYGRQHNSQGYRGRLVPLRRTPGIARILCMGGSTTYGEGAPKPDESYPAYLEQLLAKRLPGHFRGVEVINAGIPGGTSAEILTHYQFKFHYYHPDLVVINPGGNDAMSLIGPYYHPDYSHWRKPLLTPQPLPSWSQPLLRSRLVSAFLILILYGNSPAVNPYSWWQWRSPPLAYWYEPAKKMVGGRLVPYIPDEEIAFRHNLELTLDELQKDNVQVLLVPFWPAPNNRYSPDMLRAIHLEWDILARLSARRKIPLASFSASAISPQNWVDFCHTNPQGYYEKAVYLVPYVLKILSTIHTEDSAAGAI